MDGPREFALRAALHREHGIAMHSIVSLEGKLFQVCGFVMRAGKAGDIEILLLPAWPVEGVTPCALPQMFLRHPVRRVVLKDIRRATLSDSEQQ